MNNAEPKWDHERVRLVQSPFPFRRDPVLDERCEPSQCWRTRGRQLSGQLDPVPVRAMERRHEHAGDVVHLQAPERVQVCLLL